MTLFIETNCLRTKFEADTILVREFKEKYEEFCRHHKLGALDVTRSLMASHGIETEKQELSFVCRKPLTELKARAGTKPVKYYDIQIAKAEQEIEKMIVTSLIETGSSLKRKSTL